MTTKKVFRVWMKDGYASLHVAASEESAKVEAIKQATENTEGLAMSPYERRKAIEVDYVDCLNQGVSHGY